MPPSNPRHRAIVGAVSVSDCDDNEYEGGEDTMDNELKANLLGMVMLITSWGPESLWAKKSTSQYAIFMAYAKRAMIALGMEPDENARYWFYQANDVPVPSYIKSKLPLKVDNASFVHPTAGYMLSDSEFASLYKDEPFTTADMIDAISRSASRTTEP